MSVVKARSLVSKIRRRLEDSRQQKPVRFPLSPAILNTAEPKMQHYVTELEYCFDCESIQNLALSGSYGAGKSSIIETWEKHDSQRKYIHISLAHFISEESVDADSGCGEKPSNFAESQIEGKILNQLIQKIDSKRIPKSRFRRIRNSRVLDIIKTLGLFLFFVCSVILAKNIAGGGPVGDEQAIRSCVVGVTVVWLVLLIVGLYFCIRNQIFSRFIRRFKFMGSEVEIFNSSDDSIFDKYMDDILYLVGNSGYDAFVFEDLDRFGEVTVFEKLREINTLVNFSKKKHPIRFIYLVRDDLLDPSDRTKFFDYIVVVLPYVDPNNAFDVIRKGLSEVGLKASDEFLYELSLFIDDPRILRDIVNESAQIKECLQFEKNESFGVCDMERLLSLVAYKALFPSDYALLQVGKGFLHTLLTGKEWLVQHRSEGLEAQIADIEKEISSIETWRHLSIDEINLLFVASSFDRIKNYQGYFPSIQFDSIQNPQEVIEAITSNTQRKEVYEALVEKLKDNDDYVERISVLEEGSSKEIEKRQIQVQALQNQILDLERTELSQLVQELDDPSAFFDLRPERLARSADFEEYSFASLMANPKFPVIQYFIMNGKINESYSRYMSIFYQESMSIKDMDMIMSILLGNPGNPEYSFSSPETALLRISETHLKRPCARNYTLLRALLKNNSAKAHALFAGVRRDLDYDFILNYAISTHYVPELFDALNREFPEAIEVIVASSDYSDDKVRIFCHCLAATQWAKRLPSETRESLAKRASADPRFLNVPPGDYASMAAMLATIKYRPTDLDVTNAHPSLLKLVYEKNWYIPTAVLSCKMLQTQLDDKNSEQGLATLVTRIFQCENSLLKRHVETEASIFFETLLTDHDGRFEDVEAAIVWLLNLLSENEDLVMQYIDRLDCVLIENIVPIESSRFVDKLFERESVISSSSNILNYYRKAGDKISASLAHHIDSFPIPRDLNSKKAVDLLGVRCGFLASAIKCSSISDVKISELVDVYGARFNAFSIQDLNEYRIEILIEAGSIPVNNDNLLFMREHYPETVLSFVEKDIESYAEIVLSGEQVDEEGNSLFSEDEILEIFEKPEITSDLKITLLEGFNGSVRMNESYPEELNIAIVEDYFDEEDLVRLSEFCSSASDRFRSVLAAKVVERRETIFANETELSTDLLKLSLSLLAGSRAAAVQLIAWQFDTNGRIISRGDVRSVFVAADLSEYTKLIDGPRSKILRTENDMKLLAYLRRRGFCGTIKEEVDAEGRILVSSLGYKRQNNRLV